MNLNLNFDQYAVFRNTNPHQYDMKKRLIFDKVKNPDVYTGS